MLLNCKRAIRSTGWLCSGCCATARASARSASTHAERTIAGAPGALLTPKDPERRKFTWSDAGVPRQGVYTVEGAAPDAARIVCVCVHGAPGSTYDWRYLAPAIAAQPGYAVVRLELPGHGEAELYGSGDASAAAMADACVRVCAHIPELKGTAIAQEDGRGARIVLIAHSIATDPVLHLAVHRPSSVSHIVLVNPVGVRAHTALRPTGASAAIAAVLDVPLLAPLVRSLLWQLYVRVFKFPRRVSPQEVEWCHRRAVARDYARIRTNAEAVRAQGMPVFAAYARDDHLVELDVSQEIAEVVGASERLLFHVGGHYLLKAHAGMLAKELARWLTPGHTR